MDSASLAKCQKICSELTKDEFENLLIYSLSRRLLPVTVTYLIVGVALYFIIKESIEQFNNSKKQKKTKPNLNEDKRKDYRML